MAEYPGMKAFFNLKLSSKFCSTAAQPGGCAFFLPLHTVPEERSVTGGPVRRPYGCALAFRILL